MLILVRREVTKSDALPLALMTADMLDS